MKIPFYKYQGAGNDFVMVDDRSATFPQNERQIQLICDRHFGVGADGLILLQNDQNSDFKMVYFNSDGKQSTMCGNGGRCIVRFAEYLGLIQKQTRFQAIDGIHEAILDQNIVQLKMSNVPKIQVFENHIFINTGSPHHVEFVENLDEIDVKNYGKQIRFGSPYFEEGSNVNFVKIISSDSLKIRTYERGVEDETLACGTGITAAALAAFEAGKIAANEVHVSALGGELKVKFEKNNSGGYENVWLIGPAEFVFGGEFDLNF